MGQVKQYEEEFKRQSVNHILQTGKTVAQVARELGISVNTLHGWVKKYKQEPKVIKHPLQMVCVNRLQKVCANHLSVQPVASWATRGIRFI
ncbi:transposase [Bacillus thuringiensis]|nr:transposase [Bacillus thuringiensis]